MRWQRMPTSPLWAVLVADLALGLATPARGDIVLYEYYWDEDPGEGQRQTITGDVPPLVCSGAMPSPRDHTVTLADLDVMLADDQGRPLHSGPHTLFIRAMDAGGWGGWFSHPYCVPRPADFRVVGGEWFLVGAGGVIPPPGSGAPLTPTTCVEEEVDGIWQELPLPEGLSPGSHQIGFRLQDSEGGWGPMRLETIVVPDPVPSPTVVVTAKYLDGDACDVEWVCPTAPDVVLAPEGGGSYSGVIDLAAFGAKDLCDVPLYVQVQGAAGATLLDLSQLDSDGDGVLDCRDNCSTEANPAQEDPDQDGRGSACDNCPETSNLDQSDFDEDGLGDACDPDDDEDGVPDGADNCPELSSPDTSDNDGDGMGDPCDPDDDNDGRADAADNCPFASNSNQRNTDGDAEGDACDPDDDNDGILDGADNCPLVASLDQTDADGDGMGDPCDPDDDNDLVLDTRDNCRVVQNPNQADNDLDGRGDACDPDDDNDEIADDVDNCPVLASADQTDADADGMGDPCDPDDDNDGVPDSRDNCRLVDNPEQTDSDGDRIGDACDRNAFHRGDPNQSGETDLSDGIAVFNFLFLGGNTPGCMESADTNNDGNVDISDGIGILNYLFQGGAQPVLPGPSPEPCGFDPDPPGSPRDIGCLVYEGC